jgi:hypothetical protein
VTWGSFTRVEGRPSTPPEQLLSALLLQVFYGIRSERQLMEGEELGSNLLRVAQSSLGGSRRTWGSSKRGPTPEVACGSLKGPNRYADPAAPGDPLTAASRAPGPSGAPGQGSTEPLIDRFGKPAGG